MEKASIEPKGATMKARTTEIAAHPSRTIFAHTVNAALLVLALALAGCGGGGGGSAPAAVNSVSAVQTATPANSFSVTGDDYGMERPTYLAASKSSLGTVLRSAIAASMTDQNFRTLSRIDIPAGAAISTGVSYSLAAGSASTFPGTVYFFNGHQSTLLRTVGGTITFQAYGRNVGDRVAGSFSARVEDGNDTATPKASYTIAASFDFVTDSYGPVLPAPVSVTTAAATNYDANCASCHALGSHDPSASGASDLALKGGKLNGLFSADLPGHQGIRLSAAEIEGLKVLLNVN